MYKYIFAFFLLLSKLIFAQDSAISLSDSLVEFGQALCYEQQSRTLTITNNLSEPVQILSAEFYGNEFSTDLAVGEIAAAGTLDFHVYFQADQNIDYTDFLHIVLDAGNRPILVKATASAVYENNYYAATQNLWGSELKAALHNIIDGHTELSYTPGVWNALKDADEDPSNPDNVILLYTGWSYAKADQNTGDQNGWNREHVWAKAHGDFGTSAPAGTDAHHLRPTDVTVNGARGNLDFDDGGNLYTDDDGATECRYDSDSWEPRDLEKGDVARMMYYMVVRYEGDDTSYDLELVDFTPSTLSGEPLFGKQSSLYAWHLLDPVNDWERRRNDRIYTNWQHNRNPFIDYPGFASRMPSISGEALVVQPKVKLSPAEIDMGRISFNSKATYKLGITNSGNQVLNISSIESSNTDFKIDKSNITLAAGEHTYLTVSFESAEMEDTFDTSIELFSNDPDNEHMNISVQVTVSGSVNIFSGEQAPATFQLWQNYPNPFNPVTTITYKIPAATDVHMAIFNVSGKIVRSAILLNQAAGTHRISFNAKGLAGGIYFYRLKTVNYEATKKMVLLK